MQFKIPQDVQRADKIVGPLTLRQLIIVTIGGTICYMLFTVLQKQYFMEVWLPPVIIVALITLTFAFYRFHDLPFEKAILLFFEHQFKARKRTFQKMGGDVFISATRPLAKDSTKGEKEKTKEELDKERLKKLNELTTQMDEHGQNMLKNQ